MKHSLINKKLYAKLFYNLYLSLFLILFSINSYSQNSSSDEIELWSSVKYSHRFSKKLSLSVEGQLRINGNGKYFDESYYNQSFYEIETKYKLSKRFDIGLAYRGINKYDDQGNSQGSNAFKRFHSFVKYGENFNRFRVESRLQYQIRNKGKVDLSNPDKTYWRKKMLFSYNFKKWKADPEIGAEFFFKKNLNLKQNYDAYRLSLGTKLNSKGMGDVSIKYIFEKTVNTQSPLSIHILKIGYALD